MRLSSIFRGAFQATRRVLFRDPVRPSLAASYSVPSEVSDSLFLANNVFHSNPFPDLRLRKRAHSIMSSLLLSPGRPFCQCFSPWGQSKGFYRFIDNSRVSSTFLEESASRRGAQWCGNMEKIYIASDTTTLSLSGLRKNLDLGPVNHDPFARGIHVHSCLAMTGDGVPVALVDQQIWTRDPKQAGKSKYRHSLPIEDKESYKWIRGIDKSMKRLREECGDQVSPVFIFDREGDVHEVFNAARQRGAGLIVRSAWDRRLSTGDKLRDVVTAQSPVKTKTVTVPRRLGKCGRKAKVSIRFVSSLTFVSKKSPRPADVTLSVVLVREDNPPPNISKKDRLDWCLITTEPVTTASQAEDIAEKYRLRWKIEELHFVAKSGCRIENYQFETFERYSKVIVLLFQVAFEILRLTHFSRLSPDAPATIFLTELQCQVLQTKVNSRAGPHPIPTIGEAVMLIGRMGGHLGRKGDGMPGVKTLWRGWTDLQILTEYATILQDQTDETSFRD